MSHRFKVRDKVRVKSDLVIGRTYQDGWYFAQDMASYRGKIVTIAKVERNFTYRIKGDDRDFGWADDMFEPVDARTVRAERTFKDLLKKEINMYVKKTDSDYISISTLETMVEKIKLKLNKNKK